MKRTNMPLEALVTRWEDRREIQNLMGRYTYALLLKQEKDIFDIYWCQNAEAPCLGLNSGYYKGYGAIQSYYEARHQKNLLRTRLIMQDFSSQTEGKSADELYGCGVLDHKPLGNQVIEIAGDGRTAKGFWYVVGKEDEYGESGPLSYWTFGMFGVDFVWEDGQWRIWHLTYVEDIHTPCGESWAAAPKKREPTLITALLPTSGCRSLPFQRRSAHFMRQIVLSPSCCLCRNPIRRSRTPSATEFKEAVS